VTKWLVFFDSDYMVEAETAQDAAEKYADDNSAEFGQTVVVIESDPEHGATIHRFRLGAVPS
jgi:hypothetical protein